MADHRDRAIIITGAAGSIGFATAAILAKEGAKLAVVDISDKIEDCAEKLRAYGGEVIAMRR